MLSSYTEFRTLWPPRPEQAIPPGLIGFYHKRGWVGQCKMNGTCSVLAVDPQRRVIAMNRHQQPHQLWQPKAAHHADFAALPGAGWYVFVAELLHSKVAGLRDINYVHEVLVADGRHLAGTRFEQRQVLLGDLLRPAGGSGVSETPTHWQISPTLWLAKTLTSGLTEAFAAMDLPEHEGLVLKNPAGLLSHCLRPSGDAPWQVKCRRPSKNYCF